MRAASTIVQSAGAIDRRGAHPAVASHPTATSSLVVWGRLRLAPFSRDSFGVRITVSHRCASSSRALACPWCALRRRPACTHLTMTRIRAAPSGRPVFSDRCAMRSRLVSPRRRALTVAGSERIAQQSLQSCPWTIDPGRLRSAHFLASALIDLGGSRCTTDNVVRAVCALLSRCRSRPIWHYAGSQPTPICRWPITSIWPLSCI